MLEEVSNKTEKAMKKTLENLHHELAGIRTGKANPTLLDSIRVDYFGQQVPIKQVASIAVPDPRLITIQPWDRTVIPEIEKAIMSSELGLNPQNDGALIRLPVPGSLWNSCSHAATVIRLSSGVMLRVLLSSVSQ